MCVLRDMFVHCKEKKSLLYKQQFKRKFGLQITGPQRRPLTKRRHLTQVGACSRDSLPGITTDNAPMLSCVICRAEVNFGELFELFHK